MKSKRIITITGITLLVIAHFMREYGKAGSIILAGKILSFISIVILVYGVITNDNYKWVAAILLLSIGFLLYNA